MAVAGNIVVEMSLDNDKMIVGIRQAGTMLSEYQRTLTRTAASAKTLDIAHESLGTKFRHLVTTMGALRFAAMDVHDVFLRLPAAIMKTSGDLERTRALLGGLSKELTKVGRDAESAMNFGYITKMAQHAPFEISALSDSFVKLKAAGIDPAKGSLQALVDTVSKFGGTGESMKRATVAIAQMLGKGTVSLEELRQQLGETAPLAIQNMATGMGISVDALVKAVSKGAVKAGDAINKMLVIMQQDNEGAAAEMMKTWTGVTAQLKTKMQLAADDIANAGFGQAMKQAVNEISAAINGVEFRRFSDSAGQALGATVTTLGKTAKLLVEHIEVIKTAALAWVAYKIASHTVTPALLSVGTGMNVLSDEYRRQSRYLLDNAKAAKAGALEKIQLAGAEARSQMEKSALRVAALRTELAQEEINRAAALANYNRAQNYAVAKMPRDVSTGRIISREVAMEQAQIMQGLVDNNSAAMRRIKGDLLGAEKAYGRAALEALGLGNALDATHRAAVKGSGAMAALNSVMSKAGAAFNALGGWATVLNVAIMAGVWAWSKWGGAGEAAIKRISDAKKGLANEETLIGINKTRDDMRQERARLAGSLPELDSRNNEVGRKMAKDARARVAILDAELAEVNKASEMARATVDRDNARAAGARIVELANDKASSIRLASQVQLRAIDETHKAELKAAGNDEKLKAAADKKDGDARKALAVSVNSAIKKDLEARLIDTQAMFGGKDDASAKVAAEGIQEQIEAAKNKMDMAILSLGKNQISESKKKSAGKDAGVRKLQTFVENLQEEEERLKVAIEDMLSTVERGSKVGAEVAKVRRKLLNGDFEDKDKQGPVLNKARASQMAVELTGSNTALKEFYDDAKKITDLVAEMQPEYERALRTAADPLGTVELKQSAKVDQLLAKLNLTPEKLKAVSETVRLKMQEQIDLVKKTAAVIDSAPANERIAKDTVALADKNRRAGADMIADERERVIQIYKINEEAADKEDALRLRRERSIPGIDTSGLEAEMLEAKRLRLEKFAKDAKTPMQRLADDWKMSLNKMEDASARWGESFVDTIVSSAKTGKLEFGSFAESVATDILKIQLQRTLGDPLKDIIGQGTKALTGYMPDLGNNDGKTRTSTITDGLTSTAAAEAAQKVKDMATSALTAKDGLEALKSTGADGLTTSLIKSIGTSATEAAASASLSSALAFGTTSVMSFSAALNTASAMSSVSAITGGAGDSSLSGGFQYLSSMASSAFGFADGGIMTNMGAVQLRKYAAGGIARSPQLALYGEAGPEAYVPLPDGRSIPVTMSGSQQGAPSVTVNVINQSGTPVAAQQGQPRFDGKQMILDVVLSAATQPGGFRDGMKGALR